MTTNTTPANDVLHSEKHSKLSAEEIAKALARHNRHHSSDRERNLAAKANKPTKR